MVLKIYYEVRWLLLSANVFMLKELHGLWKTCLWRLICVFKNNSFFSVYLFSWLAVKYQITLSRALSKSLHFEDGIFSLQVYILSPFSTSVFPEVAQWNVYRNSLRYHWKIWLWKNSKILFPDVKKEMVNYFCFFLMTRTRNITSKNYSVSFHIDLAYSIKLFLYVFSHACTYLRLKRRKESFLCRHCDSFGNCYSKGGKCLPLSLLLWEDH